MDPAPEPDELALGDGFDALLRAEFVSIARTVYLVLGDQRVAEEITQEAFAKAWSRWRRDAHHDRPTACGIAPELEQDVARITIAPRDATNCDRWFAIDVYVNQARITEIRVVQPAE